jgi:HAD superfamily hydrolase (TIGR01509 family)
MTKPRLLLFDLGNVLVRFEPDRFTSVLGLDAHDARHHYENKMRELTNRYESGGCTTSEYFASLSAFLQNRFDEATLKEAFLSVLTDPIPGMEEVVREATARVPAAVVSNTNEAHFSSVLPRVPALRHLPKRYLSYQIGVIKPSQEFYQFILRNEKVQPNEMLFIDDVRQNISAAEQAGMAGYQFDGAEQLRNHLKTLGVL